MNICPLLFGDLNMEPTALQPCCDVHGCEVPAFPFSGGELDLRAYWQMHGPSAAGRR